eukprot:scaffold2059_cov190-Amphora_coffeaeformis.AAC.3
MVITVEQVPAPTPTLVSTYSIPRLAQQILQKTRTATTRARDEQSSRRSFSRVGTVVGYILMIQTAALQNVATCRCLGQGDWMHVTVGAVVVVADESMILGTTHSQQEHIYHHCQHGHGCPEAVIDEVGREPRQTAFTLSENPRRRLILCLCTSRIHLHFPSPVKIFGVEETHHFPESTHHMWKIQNPMRRGPAAGDARE